VFVVMTEWRLAPLAAGWHVKRSSAIYI